MKEKKRLPMGMEDFGRIREEQFYYVDKTALIKGLIENMALVNLFTRPRRFGKTLTMSMLRYFFEIGSSSALFDGLAISRESELCEKYTALGMSLTIAAICAMETLQNHKIIG